MKRTKNMKRGCPFPEYLCKGLLLLSSLLLLLLPSCSDDQGTTGSETATLSIGQVTTKTVKTRSTTAVTSGDIGVFLSGAGYTTQSNVKYSYGTAWTSTTPIYLTSTSASICAYYPYNASITDATAVPLTSQIYSSSADLCYATNTSKSSAAPSIDFVMSRAYAMMTFNITHEETYTGACVVSGIAVVNDSIKTTGILNITTGTFSSTTAGTVSTTLSSAVTVDTNATTSIQVLMVPVTTAMTGYVTVSFTVDGKNCTATIPASSLSTLVAGTNYTINASMGKTGLTTTLASISGTGSMSLIAAPLANCYMVAPSNAITIPVNIKGNGDETLASLVGGSVSFTAASVGVLWQSSAGLVSVSDFNATTQQVMITAGTASGNAVIAAYDTDGTTILWSWHIWVTDYNPDTPSNGAVYTYNDRTWMDRNLGATDTTHATLATKGLLYQWGRKDPFPGSSSVSSNSESTLYNASGTGSASMITKTVVSSSSNLANTILYPLTFYFGTSDNEYDWYSVTASTQNDALWGGASTTTPTDKTLFDPCPAGWRVPAWSSGTSPWSGFSTTTFPWYNTSAWASSYGRVYTSASNTYYPAAGVRNYNSGVLISAGSTGGYWSASPGSSYFGCYMYINSSSVSPSSYTTRGNGFSVRCIQE
jgi:hypothetical protein